MKRSAISFLALFLIASHVPGQPPRMDPAGIDGSILLCGSYKASPEMFEKFVELAGGAKAKIVILTFNKAPFGRPPLQELIEAAKAKEAAEPVLVDYADAKKALGAATGIWLHVDSVSPMKKSLSEAFLHDECQALLKRGGVFASAQAGTRYAGTRDFVANGAPCMKLLPDSVVALRLNGKSMIFPTKPLGVLRELIGYEIDGDAAMLVKGRTISVVGPGAVRVHMFAGNRPVREIILQGKAKEDLTALRRALHDRLTSFPPNTPDAPFVEKGTLVIVGGGGSPNGLYTKFIEYAGGKDKANIVVFPTANKGPTANREVVGAAFKKAGAKKATVLHGRTQKEVESKEFLDTLKEATGLWFDGGRQWRFVDCYENTKALPLMFDVLQRGGVIGGTSAGATIQGDYLARGGVFNNDDIRYEGYERGLGFLKGVAIDQHFTQRKRQKEMTELMKVYPQYLGIGIDEATAIVVKGSTADVIGKGKVHFYDTNRKIEAGQPDYEALSEGGRYDLKERKIIPAQK